MLDVTVPAVTQSVVEYAIAEGVNVLVGTSGWTAERIAGIERSARDRGKDLLRATRDGRLEQRLLGREVAVDRHLRHAGRLGDRLDARPLQAVFQKLLGCGLQHTLEALRVARSAAPGNIGIHT